MEWLRDGRTVYTLQGTGDYDGKGATYHERMENRIDLHVYGKAPETELLSTAQRIQACLNNLEGIPTAALEAGCIAELVKATLRVTDLGHGPDIPTPLAIELGNLRAALAKLKQEG